MTVPPLTERQMLDATIATLRKEYRRLNRLTADATSVPYRKLSREQIGHLSAKVSVAVALDWIEVRRKALKPKR